MFLKGIPGAGVWVHYCSWFKSSSIYSSVIHGHKASVVLNFYEENTLQLIRESASSDRNLPLIAEQDLCRLGGQGVFCYVASSTFFLVTPFLFDISVHEKQNLSGRW